MKRTTPAALVAVLVLIVAACGGSTSVGASGDTTPAAQADGESNQAAFEPTPAGESESGAASPTATVPAGSGSTESASGAVDAEGGPWPTAGGCTFEQSAITEQIEIVNIPANDPDGGLVIHTEPNVNSPETGVAPPGALLNTWEEPQYGGCIVLPSGAVWWAVVDYDGNLGWVNSAYAQTWVALHAGDPNADTAGGTGGTGGGAGGGEEADASFDCTYLPSLGDTCISVIYLGDGTASLDDPATLPVEWAQHDCVYGGNADACFVLELAGFGARGNYGLGNSLAQTPTDFLQSDCNSLGYSNGAGALACAELATRGVSTGAAGSGGAGGEAADASFDCTILPSLGDTCISVIYFGDGTASLEDPASLPVEWAQHDCVYGGNADACFVLELAGFGASGNYGLGNSLAQTPTDFLQSDCNSLGYSNGAGALACAELATRG